MREWTQKGDDVMHNGLLMGMVLLITFYHNAYFDPDWPIIFIAVDTLRMNDSFKMRQL